MIARRLPPSRGTISPLRRNCLGKKIQRYNAWVIERDNEKSSLLWFKTQFVGRWRASVQRRPYAGATLYVRQEVRIHTTHRKKRERRGKAIKKREKRKRSESERAKQFKAIRPRRCPLWPRRFIVAGANDREGTRDARVHHCIFHSGVHVTRRVMTSRLTYIL